MLHAFLSRSKVVTLVAAAILIVLGLHVLYSTESAPKWRVTGGKAVDGGLSKSDDIPDQLPPEKVEQGSGDSIKSHPSEQPKSDKAQDTSVIPCQQLPGAEDVVVIMRTGATEIQDKLPMHFETTFKCYQDLVIFSDYEEIFQGQQVHDVLAPMDQALKQNNPDFELYTRLKNHGRESLHDYELSGKASFEGSKGGKGDNPGWKLDKWKFLPMMNETLRLRPEKKWYIFVESDSYPVWSNLLQWFERLDPSQPHYFGSEVQIGPDIFAHGGSVFVMSRAGIEKGAQYYAENRQHWDIFTDAHWAGDCVLGKELREAGVPLEWAWPIFQGGHPEKMDFTEKKGDEKKLWCSSALSYHHFSSRELPRMWEFEQAWIQSRLGEASNTGRRWGIGPSHNDVLEHRDVFKNFVWPRIRSHQGEGWNNLSPNMIGETDGVTEDECQRQCQENPGCLQYSLSDTGCFISTREVMLGEQAAGYTSGWMLDRIETWMGNLDRCGGHEGWTVT